MPLGELRSHTDTRAMTMQLVIGISGATGAIYGIRVLKVLQQRPDIETHLVTCWSGRDLNGPGSLGTGNPLRQDLNLHMLSLARRAVTISPQATNSMQFAGHATNIYTVNAVQKPRSRTLSRGELSKGERLRARIEGGKSMVDTHLRRNQCR